LNELVTYLYKMEFRPLNTCIYLNCNKGCFWSFLCNFTQYLIRFSGNSKITFYQVLLPAVRNSLITIFAILCLSFLMAGQVSGQNCGPNTPSLYVDLGTTPIWQSVSTIPNGPCCTAKHNENCIELVIKLPDDATAINLAYTTAQGSFEYYVDCENMGIAPTSNLLRLCFEEPGGTHSVTFCRPGTPSYIFTVSPADLDAMVTLEPFAPVCHDTPQFRLQGGSPQYGTYYVDDTPVTFFNPATWGPGNHEVTYVWEDPDTGCSGQATQTITVGPLPPVVWSGQEFCKDTGLFLLDMASPPGGVFSGSLVTGNYFNVGAAVPGNYPVTYTFTDDMGCSALRTANVVVHALPHADAGPDQTTIKGNNVLLEAADGGTGSYLYQWAPPDSVINPNSQQTLTTDLFVSNLFRLTVTDQSTGCKASDQVAIRIVAGDIHISELISSPPAICYGDTAFLWALPGGGSGKYLYEWSSNPHDPSLDLQVNDSVPFISPSETTIYTVVISDEEYPESYIHADIVVTVNPLPVVTLDEYPPVCANTPGFSLTGGNHHPYGTYSLLDEHGDYLYLPYLDISNFLPHDVGEGNYQVLYEYTDLKGCTNHDIQPLEILPYVKAEFFVSRPDICTSNEVMVINNSIGADTYVWDFGSEGTADPDTDQDTFLYTYREELIPYYGKELTIELYAAQTSPDGFVCHHSQKRKITVYPEIIALFTPDVEEGCTPHTVEFVNESTGPVLFYYWDFGDGTSSIEDHPIHTFTNNSDKDTTYIVSLTIVSTNFFCSERFSWPITVHPKIEAGFTFTPSAGCSPMELEIHNTSIGADIYLWDFGDGGSSISGDSIILHTYENNGLYSEQYLIRQFVENNAGCKDSLERVVTVYPYLEASFTASETEGCADLFVEFTNTSTLTAQQIYWDFGDGGTSSDPNPHHTFKNTTDTTIVYEVSLTVVSADFCEDISTMEITVHPYLEAGFDFTPAEACNPHEITFKNTTYGATSYEWNFGDGTVIVTNDTLPLTHTYDHDDPDPVVYEIIMTASNDEGCTESVSRSLTIYPKIIADFSVIADEGCNQLEVQFINNSTGVHEYLWDFGDGGTSSDPEPFHIFKNESFTDIDTFNVWLYVESEFLCRDSISMSITVYPAIKADFTIDIVEDCSPFEVEINNHSAGVLNYSWNFGNGDSSDSGNPVITHTFYNTGNETETYTIELIVDNEYGCTDTLRQDIRVFPEVRADFTPVVTGCHPLDVNFLNNSENADYYFWDFGDDNYSDKENPVHTYYNLSHFDTELYNVELRAESIHGCFAIFNDQITVNPKPEASFIIENSPGCSPYEIIITNNSQGVSDYSWNFGDGNTSESDANLVTHTYNHDPGNGIGYFDIELIVFNGYGCSDTLVQQAIIYPNVVADFTSDVISGCHPLTVEFTNNSYGADAQLAYYWNYGDGNSSHTKDGSHFYEFRNFSHTKDITYRVMLVAQNVNGCTDTTHVDVTVFAKPLAFFNIPHDHACAPYEINVHNFSVGVDNYLWNISDGAQYTYNTSHFTHTLNQAAGTGPGTYTVSLDVSNNQGCTNFYSQEVVIYPEVIAMFATDNEGCHMHEAVFENQSVGADLYYWSFGNGNTSKDNQPYHTFLNYSHTESQTYTVHLRSESHYGCFAEYTEEIMVRPIPKPLFEISKTEGCSPFTTTIHNVSVGATQFDWSFGNGVSDESADSFIHSWTNTTESPVSYTTLLTVSNEFGCEAQTSQALKVFPEITASFGSEGDIWEGCSPLDIRFLNSSILATTYKWDFEDGAVSSSANPINQFINHDTENKLFTVELTATSLYGCTDTNTREVTVFPTPDVFFTAQPYSQPYPESTITLTNLTNPGTWNFHWEFGDGIYLHTPDFNPFIHTYLWETPDMNTKTYTVALMASNGECSGMFTQLVTITSPVPLAQFSSEQSGCEPFPVKFTNRSIYAHTFWWDFDDGSVSADPEPLHNFIDPGIYNVRLVAIGDGGRDTIYHTIEVLENPTADFDLETTLVHIPEEPLRVINKSRLGDFYLWDFGDGNTSNAFEPVHYYRHPGLYDISLTVTRATQPQCHDFLKKSNALRVDESCTILFPNAFKPSHNGPSGGYYDMGNPSTEIFHPVYQGIEDYVLEIYTRWGELIFRSEDINIGWDGYVKGQLAKMDVYVWKVRGTCTDGAKIHQAGDVTLYR
jgi:PKD repeat protein